MTTLNLSNLVTIQGILSLVATLITFITVLILTLLRWHGVFGVILYLDDFGWQLLYVPLLMLVFVFSAINLACVLTGNHLVDRFGKLKAAIPLVICLVFLIVSGIVIAHYAVKSQTLIYDGPNLKARFIVSSIFVWATVLNYVGQIVLIFIYR